MQPSAHSYAYQKSFGFTSHTVHRTPPRVIALPVPRRPLAEIRMQRQKALGWPRMACLAIVAAAIFAALQSRELMRAMPSLATVATPALGLVHSPGHAPMPVHAAKRLPAAQSMIAAASAKPANLADSANSVGLAGVASIAGGLSGRGGPATAMPATRQGGPVILALTPRGQADQTHEPSAAPLFSSHSWNPPAPPPPVVAKAPLPKPTAPPLPFTYLGKMLDAGVWEAYLARGEETFVVREHAPVDANYRVESIVPPIMTITYLPLKQAQTLAIGEQ